MLWDTVIASVTTILDKVIPDPQKAAEAKLKLVELAQQGDAALLDFAAKMSQGQTDVNKAEASSSDPYTSRWRPTIGYVLAAALAFQYLINPLLIWANAAFNTGVTPPSIGLDDHMWELVMGVLGLAGWRTLDKIKGGV